MDEGPVSDVTRIVIVDDHPIVRAALRSLFERQADLAVVGEAGDLVGARDALTLHRPQVLVLDVNLPDGSALTAIPGLRSISPETAIVVLTADRNVIPPRQEAEAAGIHGALAKNAEHHELITAVREVAAGRRHLPTSGRLSRLGRGRRSLDSLSQREKEVLRLLALGHSGREVAERLSLSLRTVETHREHIQQKLDLTSRAELTGYALRNRLLMSSS